MKRSPAGPTMTSSVTVRCWCFDCLRKPRRRCRPCSLPKRTRPTRHQANPRLCSESSRPRSRFVSGQPHLFVSHSESFPIHFHSKHLWELGTWPMEIDPYFPGWTDTVQLDYRRTDTRNAMSDLVYSVSKKCDGSAATWRCFCFLMIFHGTWSHVLWMEKRHSASSLADAISRIKTERPDFTSSRKPIGGLKGGSVIWDSIMPTYKHLYDLLVHDRHWRGATPSPRHGRTQS